MTQIVDSHVRHTIYCPGIGYQKCHHILAQLSELSIVKMNVA